VTDVHGLCRQIWQALQPSFSALVDADFALCPVCLAENPVGCVHQPKWNVSICASQYKLPQSAVLAEFFLTSSQKLHTTPLRQARERAVPARAPLLESKNVNHRIEMFSSSDGEKK